MEICQFCGKVVVNEMGNRTEDFGRMDNKRYICIRCIRAFEFSLGV